jgi:DNA-binding transcriptional MerR regulator
MPKVDMSAQAITTRLKRVEQLRRLGLSLKKAKIMARVRLEQPGPKQEQKPKEEDFERR